MATTTPSPPAGDPSEAKAHNKGYIHGHHYILNTQKSSLFCLGGSNPLRLMTFRIIESNLFVGLIALFIAANVGVAMIDTPGWRDLEYVPQVLNICDICFQVVFTLELIMKVVALGLIFHRHSFLRSLQNSVDALLVLVGFVQFVTSNSLVVRLMRLTRSLRAFAFLTRFAKLRAIFVTLRIALPKLRDIVLLTMFVIISMSVLGLQLFTGSLDYRCYLSAFTFDGNSSTQLSRNVTWVVDPTYPDMVCSNDPSAGFQCPTPGSVCDRHDDVYHFPYRNFDYIWTSIYAVFKFIVQDNWPTDIQRIQAANGTAYFFFGFVIVLFGTFFALNLVIAVLSNEFQEVTEKVLREEEARESKVTENLLEADALAKAGVDAVTSQVKRLHRSEDENVDGLNAYFQLTPPRDAEGRTDEPPPPPPCFPVWALRRVLWQHVASRAWFRQTALFFTLLNIIVLATDHYGIDDMWNTVNSWINFSCSIFFFLEAAIKIIAMATYYFRDPFNLFDLAICAVSAVELAYSAGASSGSTVTALRAFRLARVVRIINSNATARQLILTVVKAAQSASLLFLFLIMYVIAGAILATNIHPDAVDSSKRPNYTNFLNAMLGMFLIISGENWNDDVAAIMAGFTPDMIAFYIPYMVVATFIVINFVVVILINSFQQAAEDVVEEERTWNEMADLAAAEMMATHAKLVPLRDGDGDGVDGPGMFSGVLPISGSTETDETQPPQGADADDEDAYKPTEWKRKQSVGIVQAGQALLMHTREFVLLTCHSALADFFGMPTTDDSIAALITGRSLKLFDPDHPIRRFCAGIALNPYYELVAMLVVIEGCVALLMENNTTRDDPTWSSFFDVSAYLNLGFFTFEVFVKWIAFGVVVGEHAYFRNKWNVTDFLILALSYVAMFLPVKPIRALRIFRIATRWPAMRLILWSLAAAIPGVGNIVGLLVFFFLITGIVCVQIFKGRMFSCSDKSILTKDACVGFAYANQTVYYNVNGTFYPNITLNATPRQWTSSFFNFNHVGQAFLSMILLQYSNGWSELLFPVMDAADSDTSSTSMNNSWGWAFLFCYLFMQNNYFMNNLFVGSLINSFSTERARNLGKVDGNGKVLLTDAQERWIREYRFVSATQLPRLIPAPHNPVRRFLAWIYFADDTRLDPRPLFDWTITACILINVAFMMSQYDGQPDYWTQTLYWINVGFVIVFGIEFLIKLIAMRPIAYFSERWNVFDFLMLVAALISVFLNGPGMNAVRVLRVARVLRLIRRAKGLYRLFESLVYALPQLFNVIVLTLLVLFVFGVIGVALFENLLVDNTGDGTFNSFANFQNVPVAMMTLFQTVSSAWWSDPLAACAATEDNSSCTDAAGNCGSYWAYPFFLLAMLFGNSVCVNLFIFVVVDNYSEVSQISSHTSQYLLFRLNNFRRKWVLADPERHGTLSWRTFVKICRQMQREQEAEYAQFLDEVWGSDPIIDEKDKASPQTEVLLNPLREMFEVEDDEEEDAGSVAESEVLQAGVSSALVADPTAQAPSLHRMDALVMMAKVKAMDIPMMGNGLVNYEDCILGMVKEFYRIDDSQLSEEGEAFLSALVQYERKNVFRLHHAMAVDVIGRAFVRCLHAKRKEREARTRTATMPLTMEDAAEE